MITKPSIWDYKYDKMNGQETMLNYDRDMMLYEQTVALQKLSGQRDLGENVAILLTPSNLDDTLECSKFERGTKEYEYFEKLRLQRLKLLNKAKYLYLNIGGGILFFIVCNIVFMPLTLCVNLEALKIQLFVFIFQLLDGMLLISKARSIRADADKLLEKRNKFVRDCEIEQSRLREEEERQREEEERQREEERIRNTEHLSYEIEDYEMEDYN